MAEIEFVWDSRELEVWRGDKVDKALENALRKAGTSALRVMKTTSSKLVRERKRFQVTKVNKGLLLSYPPRSGGIAELIWRMDVSGEPMPVSAFHVLQTTSGVLVDINARKTARLPHAFIAKMKSEHIGVFVRKGKKRLPIRELFTTKLSDVFNDADVVPTVENRARAEISRAFASLLPLELDKVK